MFYVKKEISAVLEVLVTFETGVGGGRRRRKRTLALGEELSSSWDDYSSWSLVLAWEGVR
ncbi:Hypothetical protein FKW44_011435 [Caligus rogercresseyi]|uniref:Uncharacterized protein n=1 Tax=Caligus rogercresseyi TaxID=217165 RepID=A0A7T8HIM8_CALRO|nr:Hypothetical protein FKW44_011435 [Caligus rogercresseyi]